MPKQDTKSWCISPQAQLWSAGWVVDGSFGHLTQVPILFSLAEYVLLRNPERNEMQPSISSAQVWFQNMRYSTLRQLDWKTNRSMLVAIYTRFRVPFSVMSQLTKIHIFNSNFPRPSYIHCNNVLWHLSPKEKKWGQNKYMQRKFSPAHLFELIISSVHAQQTKGDPNQLSSLVCLGDIQQVDHVTWGVNSSLFLLPAHQKSCFRSFGVMCASKGN